MRTVWGACAASLAIGLFFIFVWAPHPWGWEGFDNYHQLALAVAHGQPFPTMEVPWGYAYFLAAFYRAFGDHPWIPLVAQALLNASIPLLTFLFASTWLDRRTAAIAALLTGLFSFNTVYASTQSSDAVCTVLFMTAVVVFARALDRTSWTLYALVGVLAGIAPQFRPNLILIPLLLAAYAVWQRRSRLGHAALLLAAAALVLAPWIVRNYRLTRTILPTSVHGGVQLWYGTLQVGPYLNSRAYNPRSAFEAPAFDYTSLDQVPLIVSAAPRACASAPPERIALTYWTDRDRTARPAPRVPRPDAPWTFEIPAPGGDAVVYFYFSTTLADGVRADTPDAGPRAPFVYFVTEDHLGDQDVHGDLLDIFDLVRAARARVWGEPTPQAAQLEAAGVRGDDPDEIAAVLASAALPADEAASARVAGLSQRDDTLVMTLHDGSSIVVPRQWSGRITDLTFAGPAAQTLMHAHVPLASLEWSRTAATRSHDERCAGLENVRIDDVFYRREPHLMRRYSALAWDNIRRKPVQFAVASAYRAVRLFLIYGTGDVHTAQQFARSRLVYLAGTLVSAAYLILFVAGVWVAWRTHRAIALPLLLILYVPATIAPVLTNMRYTITVQPIVFMFIAVAITAGLQRAGWLAAPPEAHGRAGSRTARQP